MTFKKVRIYHSSEFYNSKPSCIHIKKCHSPPSVILYAVYPIMIYEKIVFLKIDRYTVAKERFTCRNSGMISIVEIFANWTFARNVLPVVTM